MPSSISAPSPTSRTPRSISPPPIRVDSRCPTSDYYFKTDAKSVELREKLEKHIAKMFVLYGESPDKAAADAKTVMKVETDLAKGSLDRTEQRDPTKVYHKMTVADLQKDSPAFTWNQYFTTIQSPTFDSLNVAVPDFVKGDEPGHRQ